VCFGSLQQDTKTDFRIDYKSCKTFNIDRHYRMRLLAYRGRRRRGEKKGGNHHQSMHVVRMLLRSMVHYFTASKLRVKARLKGDVDSFHKNITSKLQI